MGIILCGIFGCSNRRGFAQYSFFKTPKVVYGQGDATRLLSEERRRLWKAAVRRQDIVTEAEPEAEGECFHTSLYRHPNPYLSVYFHNIFSAIYCSYFMKSIGH